MQIHKIFGLIFLRQRLTVCLLLSVFSTAYAGNWCPALLAPPSQASNPSAYYLTQIAKRQIEATPQPLAHLHVEGTLPGQGIRDQSINAQKDLFLMRNFAVAWRVTSEERYLNQVNQFLLTWVNTYQPNFNPIDETSFEALIDTYAVVQEQLPSTTKTAVANFLHTMVQGYIQRMNQGLANKAKWASNSTWNNNWQSHRVKLVTLIAVALNDSALFNQAKKLFIEQLNNNIRSDGSSVDFEQRDALEYHVFSLEALVRAAIAAKTQGENWFHLKGSQGQSVSLAITWLMPYVRGEKTHEEFVNTTVSFDKKRRDAGMKGFSGLWDVKTSTQLFALSKVLVPEYQKILVNLNKPHAWVASCWQ